MKKLILFSISALLLLNAVNCKKPDNVIYKVFDNKEQGAVLRTIERVNTSFNINDPNSTFEVIVEEQDPEYGDLLDKVNVYVSFIDKTDDGVDNNVSEQLLNTIPKSSFSTSPKDLPMTTVSVIFADALSTLNLQSGQYFGGDIFKFRLELVLTDGRTFSEESTSGTLQQSFFSSPFAYYASIVCPPVAGDYQVVLHDSYGDGWQGSKIIFTVDGVSTELALPNYWDVQVGSVGDPQYVQQSFTVTIPAGFQSVSWVWESGDFPSEATFEVYGPNSGTIIYQGGPSQPDGEFVPNYCNE